MEFSEKLRQEGKKQTLQEGQEHLPHLQPSPCERREIKPREFPEQLRDVCKQQCIILYIHLKIDLPPCPGSSVDNIKHPNHNQNSSNDNGQAYIAGKTTGSHLNHGTDIIIMILFHFLFSRSELRFYQHFLVFYNSLLNKI